MNEPEALEAWLADFLVEAKRSTYAAEGDASAVGALLSGSRQLEYARGARLYRDIYFGSAYFVGQETVSEHGTPLWSMSYAGGVLGSLAPGEIQEVYAFLRRALRQCARPHVFRGPPVVREGPYTYHNESQGDWAAFYGQESVLRGQDAVYALRYSGGRLR